MNHLGDCLEILSKMESNSVDSLVTDPPAGISFMGKAWDHHKGGRDDWIEWMRTVMSECLRVLKPGAHGLVWALPRTSHWTATALENAGFEVRDVVTHLFGTGFPKSLNLGNGWGTALKPASEHWILIRKPCSEKTVAANVEKWGTGGINVDECRVGTDKIQGGRAGRKDPSSFNVCIGEKPEPHSGRFPANLILDEHAAELLDEQSGEHPSAGEYKASLLKPEGSKFVEGNTNFGQGQSQKRHNVYAGQTGGASRFFYCAKASKSERGEDNKHPTVKSLKLMRYLCKLVTPPNGVVLDPFMGSGSTGIAANAEGFQFIGIEKEPDYFAIAEGRLALTS